MFRTEGNGLIGRTKLFSFFVRLDGKQKKLKYLTINALPARLKILFKKLPKTDAYGELKIKLLTLTSNKDFGRRGC